jgi:UDP-3-O-[3-hydroxymyristoyl] glucosamine N-acyltransferase
VGLYLSQITEALGGELHGNPQTHIDRLAPLVSAGPSDLGFLSHPKYQSQLTSTQAACVVVSPELAPAAQARGACIVTPDPYHYFARLTQLWRTHHPLPAGPRIHPTAVIDPAAFVDATAHIGPLCVVEAGARIGAYSRLHARVHVGHDCVVGQNCILHPGVVLGADGFGFAPHEGTWVKIEQLGAVRLGDSVELGANTCVDRGALEDTTIGHGVKIDNLVQIGHNVHIGDHSALAGCAGVAGSARIGAHCTLGGGAIVLGHLALADHVHISAASVVTRSIHQSGHYSGFFPIDDNAAWEKNAASLRQLHRLRERIKALEQRPQPPL